MYNHITVFDEISNFAQLYAQKISNYQLLKWKTENSIDSDNSNPSAANSNCFLIPFRVQVTGVLL